MIQFPDDFFEPEVRLDFHIDSKMKHVWAMEMEVLAEIDRICQKHKLKYFAYSGTLLGAIRHGGFIPWDDDIDIAMKREDYKKFAQIVTSELPEGWKYFSIYTDENWDAAFSRIVNTTMVNASEEHLKKNHGCPFIVGVDIFPLDYLAPDEKEADIVYLLLQHISGTAWKIRKNDTEELEKCLAEIEEMCKVKFVRDHTLLRQLLKLMDAVGSLYSEKEADRLISVSFSQLKSVIPCYQKEWFAECIHVPFENITVAVPVGYDEVLKVAFGEDYMVPVRNVEGGHDYPFFKDQDRFLQEMLEKQEKEAIRKAHRDGRGLRTLLIGDTKRMDDIYPWIQKATERFDVVLILSENGLESLNYTCPIETMSALGTVENEYDIIFITSQFYEKIKNILIMQGFDKEIILPETQLRRFLTKKDIMGFTAEWIYKYQQMQYVKDNVQVGEFTYGVPSIWDYHDGAKLSVGKYCSIAPNVTIMLGGEHRTAWCTTYPFDQILEEEHIADYSKTKGDITIGNDVWVAKDSTILSGVHIGDGCVVGNKALVTKDIEPYSIVGGIPARVIRKRFDEETIQRLEEIQWWNWKEEHIYDAIPLLQSDSMEKLFAYYENVVKAESV